MSAEQITITCNPDGSYTVASAEDEQAASAAGIGAGASEPGEANDQPLNQTVKTVDEVLQLVRQELGDDQGPEAQWQAEASQRDATGQRVPPGAGAPAMSM